MPFSVLIFIVFAFDPVLFSMCFHFTEESLLFYVVLYTRPISLPQVVIIMCVRFGTADAESLMHTPMRLGFFLFFLPRPPPPVLYITIHKHTHIILLDFVLFFVFLFTFISLSVWRLLLLLLFFFCFFFF